ncbi:MAG: SulP family inorganic anion transporter [Actinomycetota bacterium]
MHVTRPSNGDLVAGVSVAMVAIPQSLAYAELAGMPAQYGLFASALPPLLAAIFVSSRYLQTGPVALTALLSFGALSGLAEPASSEYIALAALLALMVGIMRTLFGLVRMGSVAYLLSEPVLLGFTTGAAILITASQLPRMFDLDPDGRNLERAAIALTSPGDWSWTAIGFAVMAAVVIVGGRRIHKLFPGVLVAVAAGVLLSAISGYSGSTVGELEGGFISLRVDFPWAAVPDLLIPALAIALVGFAEPASIARTFAAEERELWDANREMVSQGVANLASGVSGAFPVGGSFSRSSLNRLAGATSPWSGAITGLIVLLALPLTPVIADLPSAILGAIVIVAVFKLINVGDLIALVRQSRAQSMVAVGTLVATLATAPRVEQGVLIGIGLALAVHLYRELVVRSDVVRTGGTVTLSFHGVLWFASVPSLDIQVRQAVADREGLERLVVDLGGVGRMDYSGASSMLRIATELESAGIDVVLVRIPPGATRAVRAKLAEIGSPHTATPIGSEPRPDEPQPSDSGTDRDGSGAGATAR